MAKIIVFVKAILTRIIFATHGFIAIWRVATIKSDPFYWYLSAAILALAFEGIFTLTIKSNQEWKWFCPSVFCYLCSVVPAIWIIEVDKFDKNLLLKEALKMNITLRYANATKEELATFQSFGLTIGVPFKLTSQSWATVIEQFLMLILIIGRWMLPKGKLTRDQLSQLLLVYIGTAADIIEFLDSFKDEKIAENRTLCLMILSIWSWSLLQFTFVLTATKARRGRIAGDIRTTSPKAKFKNGIIKVKRVCCSIDVWAILINIILQDAPFLIFRALLIAHFYIITYMNVFFTCKNTLVIVLQFYRLFVVQIEKKKEIEKAKGACENLVKAMGQTTLFGKPKPPRHSAKRAIQNKIQRETGSGGKSNESISSLQGSNGESRERKFRRKSLSTGDLRQVTSPKTRQRRAERDEIIQIETYDDDMEAGTSQIIDQDESVNDSDEVEILDEISYSMEQPPKTKRKIRLSENPGVFKISGSRSSGESSDHVQYRHDTGYSSSSKESAGSRRGRQRTIEPQQRNPRSTHKAQAHAYYKNTSQPANQRKRTTQNTRGFRNRIDFAEIERRKERAALFENERI